MLLSYTEENYLKTLYSLCSLNGEASVNQISKKLGIKMPTVNNMMKRLSEKGLVLYKSYKPLQLTEEGKKTAVLIIRKHRLTEMYLVEKMGFDREEVHQIAEQIEHIQSPPFFAKMDQLLGYPKVDPHGSLIPDSNGVMKPEGYLPLQDCKAGDVVIFMAVKHSSEELLKHLAAKNLNIGATVTVLSIEPFDSSISVRYAGRNAETFSRKISSNLLVRPAG